VQTLKQTLLQEAIPVWKLELDRSECRFSSVAEIAQHLKQQIEANRSAQFIAIFDHYAHTLGLAGGHIADEIRAAVNVVFCLGLTLPDPTHLAKRPSSIGVCETEAGFMISFMEPPMPVANALMEDWAKSLLNAVA
jgi:hypothetical protein